MTKCKICGNLKTENYWPDKILGKDYCSFNCCAIGTKNAFILLLVISYVMIILTNYYVSFVLLYLISLIFVLKGIISERKIRTLKVASTRQTWNLSYILHK